MLLYAPSGAGKSSLVRAALVPRLRDEGFLVRPLIRVGAAAAAGLGGNRFRAATLLSLDEGRPATERLPAGRLLGLSLQEYMATLPASESEEVLIFDQFEEVISADPADRAAKQAFFGELGALLENPRRWALFILREDFLGALKPLLLPIPTRLATTYRLDLLSPAQARLAMQGPARATGVQFSDEAADRLVDDLRRTMVQQPDGTSEPVLGQSVEPVQLQVACYQLWDRLLGRRVAGPGGPPPLITRADVEAAGDVDSALRSYYAGRVAAIVAAGAASERQIREWVERTLITPAGLRGQALREPAATGGLANATIGELVDAHLVRGEERRGATWYELAHDRLIEPIRQDNAAWFESHLSPLQRKARLWERAGRPDGLLPVGAELRALARDSSADADLSPAEQAFLGEAQALDQQRRRAVARNLLIFALAGCAIGLLYGVTQFYLRAQSLAVRGAAQVTQLNTAEANARDQASLAQTAQADTAAQLRLAQAQRLAAQSQMFSSRYPDRARLLAVEAMRASDPPLTAAAQALHDSLAAPLGTLIPATAGISGSLWLSPSGRYLAAGTAEGALRVWDLAAPAAPPAPPGGPPLSAALAAFSPDSAVLVAADLAGGAWAWPLAGLADPPIPLDTGGAALGALAFDRAGALLAGGADGLIRRWPPGGLAQPPQILRGPEAAVTAIGFSGTFGWVLAGDAAGGLFYWPQPDSEPAGVALPRRDAAITALFLDVDSQQIISLAGGRVLIASLDGLAAVEISGDEVLAMQQAGSGDLLLSSRRRPGASLDVSLGSTDGRASQIARGNIEEILAQALSPAGNYVASGGRDGVIRLRRFSVASFDTLTLLAGHSGAISRLAFSPDGDWLASQGAEGDVRIWRIADAVAGSEPLVLLGFSDYVRGLRFSPDSASLTLAAGTAARWTVGGPGGIVEQPLARPASQPFLTDTAVSADGRFVAFSSTNLKTLDLYDLDRARPDPRIALAAERREGVAAARLVFSPAGDLLATTLGAEVAVWRSADLTREPLRFAPQSAPTALAFSPSGTTLALGSARGAITLWPLGGGEALILAGDAPLSRLAFSPDGATLAAAGASGVQLFDLGTGGLPMPLAGVGAEPTALAFSPDGRLLAAGRIGELRVWSLATPEQAPASLAGFEGSPAALAFSPDGSALAVGGLDGNVYLYQTARLSDEPLVLRGHRLRLYTLAFSPDGRLLASGGRDLAVRVWRLDSAELIALACTSAGRDLSPDEWRLYMGSSVPYRPSCP